MTKAWKEDAAPDGALMGRSHGFETYKKLAAELPRLHTTISSINALH
jgi:hypothetical protein